MPMRVDEITTVESINGVGSTVKYHNSLAYTPKSKEDEDRFGRLLQDHLLVSGCHDPNMLKLLMAGYTVEFRYRFNGGDETSSALTLKSCEH